MAKRARWAGWGRATAWSTRSPAPSQPAPRRAASGTLPPGDNPDSNASGFLRPLQPATGLEAPWLQDTDVAGLARWQRLKLVSGPLQRPAQDVADHDLVLIRQRQQARADVQAVADRLQA